MSVVKGLEGVDWAGLANDLDFHGWSLLEKLLTPGECDSVADLYDDDSGFRSRVVMARHGFGRGEYSYFAYPLPRLVAELRTALYPLLVPTANRWNEAMRKDVRYPGTHAEVLARCHGAGQRLPTPLLLRYAAGDYNCLHQDQYGEHVFPLQVAILLSEPEWDFTGGEFVLTEQRPRMQSRAEVVPLHRGDGVVIAVERAAGAGKAWQPPGPDAARGQPVAVRPPRHAGSDLSRCAMRWRRPPVPVGAC